MAKTIDAQAVQNAKTAYMSFMADGLTHKQAITQTGEALDIPRRRVNDWAKDGNWEAEAPETEAAHTRKLASQADASETVIEHAKRVADLEAAGELPAGTNARIIAGKTTARKVLNAYDKKVQERKPYPEREHKITVMVTNAELDNYLERMEKGDEVDDNELVKATLKFYIEMRKKAENRSDGTEA